jgi:pimeloyl-ACP methyl ester carboxylesterase
MTPLSTPLSTGPSTGPPTGLAAGADASAPEVVRDGGRQMPDVPGVTHRFVRARGARFHVAQAGSGDPVVLLHGLPQHWYAWRKVIPELAGDFELFCIDLRGCGWSEGTRRGYGTTAQARDILAVMDALGLDRVRLIGHETGGWVGFEVCLVAPERFSAFLALNTSHPWPGRAALIRHAWRFWYTACWEYPGPGRAVLRYWPRLTRALLRRWAGRSYRWDQAVLDEFVQASQTKAMSRAIEQTLWQYVLRDIPALVLGGRRKARLTVPTLILGGELDPVSRLTPAQDLRGHADDLRAEIVPGGHLLAETTPRLVAAAARQCFG